MSYVSVIIPAFNAADFIIDSYQSIVDQTIGDWELIFVNDGSEDGTLSVVKSLAAADKRIKVIDFSSNSGPACARNAGLVAAVGDWIALLDADDRYSRDRLEVLIRDAEKAGADIVLDNQFVVDPTSKRVAFLAIEPPKDEVVPLEFGAFLRNVQSSTFFDFGYLKPIIRRRWLEANGIKYREKLRLGEDLMFLMDCYARRAKVILVSKPYYYYSFQYSQISRTMSPTTRTEARYEPLLAAMELYLKENAGRQSHLERRLIASACEAVRDTMVAKAMKVYLRDHDHVGIACCLLHPIRLFRGFYFAKKRSLSVKRRVKSFPLIEGA
jgi:succinoglycan biosynthesis protein ExoO